MSSLNALNQASRTLYIDQVGPEHHTFASDKFLSIWLLQDWKKMIQIKAAQRNVRLIKMSFTRNLIADTKEFDIVCAMCVN